MSDMMDECFEVETWDDDADAVARVDAILDDLNIDFDNIYAVCKACGYEIHNVETSADMAHDELCCGRVNAADCAYFGECNTHGWLIDGAWMK